MFNFTRNKQILVRLHEYLRCCRNTLVFYRDGIECWSREGRSPAFRQLTADADRHESEADDLRYAIETELYGRSLLPDMREDIFNLLERFDLIPNNAEDVLRAILNERLDLPDFMAEDLKYLADLAITIFDQVVETFDEVFGRNRRVKEMVLQVQKLESAGDRVEQRLIARIFRSDLEASDRILLKGLVTNVGSLLDLADDVATVLNISAVKRRI